MVFIWIKKWDLDNKNMKGFKRAKITLNNGEKESIVYDFNIVTKSNLIQ